MRVDGDVIAGLRTNDPSTDPREDGRTRRGRVVHFGDTGKALRLAGLREILHPDNVVGCVYPDLDYFNFSAARDRSPSAEAAAAGLSDANRVYGPYPVDGGLLGIVDMNPAMNYARAIHDGPAWEPLDPALPDDCHHSCQCHHPQEYARLKARAEARKAAAPEAVTARI